jgi:hypothetical protein
LEKAGVPSVTIVTDEFLTLANTEAQMRGMSDLPLVRVPHPVGAIGLDRLAAIAEGCVEAIIARLSKPIDGADCDWAKSPTGERSAQTAVVEVPSGLAAMLSEVVARGWSDGLPVLPPTRQAVELMIQTIGLNADHALGVMPPLTGIATIEKIAANAVMAGCLPEYFPLVIAAVKGVLQPGFNLDGVQTTTGNVAPVVIVNGPCRDVLQINYGANAFGQGWRANATIGRALRFILTNIGGATPGLYDKSTLGQPAKYTFCFGENEEQNPWDALHVECGFARNENVVSVFGCSGVNSAVDMASQTAKGLLKTFALTMMGGLASGVTSTEVMFVVCPEHADIFAKQGYSKQTIRAALFETVRVPHDLISDENLELLSKRRPQWFNNGSGHVGAVDRPEDIWIVVAGGAGAKSAYLPGRTGTKLQSTRA